MNRYIFVLAAILSVACAASLDWRVIGGSKAEDGQFPYQVSIQQFFSHICGGSIISDQWILTAGHCLDSTVAMYMTVATGTTKLDEGDTYRVARTIAHEEFSMKTLQNDIALVQVKGRIAFNAKVLPILLETSHIGAGADVILSGWGTTSFPGGSTPNDLQFVPLKTITSEECHSRHQNTGRGRNVSSSQLCTWTKIGEGACHGDSGGPLTHSGKVAGIVSWGYPCADGYPDVFTRVSSYIDWINENMK